MRNIQAFLSLSTIMLALLFHSNSALAAAGTGSIEFMCKTKAKEIAAETYSGCINDNKQAELERIRKEYQAELAQVKAKYNSELQGLKKGKIKASAAATSAPTASTLRDMPAKKMKTSSKVKTEKIDFSSDSSDQNSNESQSIQAEATDTVSSVTPEIVEIPVQEE